MNPPKMTDLLERKKSGNALTEDQIRFWVKGLVQGTIPDYQTSALLMAIRLKGMTFPETLALTQAMAESGEQLHYPQYPMVFDKHSTGGVGDKVTLILAPLLAACGLPVSMLSGRGLGHTGGTIDKFESVEGAVCKQSPASMARMMDAFGWANAQASEAMNPADRKLYALRDVTATVDSIPLIVASIISKKLSGGATHLCLDVKCGGAAFMQTREAARDLAKNLKTIGEMGGLTISGFLTRMEEPLGYAIGNYLEVIESLAYLREWQETPLMDLVETLCVSMLISAGKVKDQQQASALLKKVLQSGEAYKRLVAYLSFIGATDAAMGTLEAASFETLPRTTLVASTSGFITRINGLGLGDAMIEIGAGRKQREDAIDPNAGLVLAKHVGDEVEKGEPLAWLYGEKAPKMTPDYFKKVRDCFLIEDQRSEQFPVIIEALE